MGPISEQTESLEAFSQALHANWIIKQHDLTVELYVHGLATLRAIATDPEFASFHHLEEPYLSRLHMVASLGWVEAFIENGKVVNVAEDGKPTYKPSYAAYVKDGGELDRAFS
ncbi:hypothetical protein EYZ11_011957 [Aspergillus tanneri]|uniref:Uncharacterized protein n=1 Tax=Aspergillus tanneri TaxID=1220188 RepID=A0A4S3J214_9EURO|nr:hypothetical protein EYZ11_011957 [Aspergillus tanneri]